ncbi:hypothetical protein [Bacillus atrophaeus]|uniref:hypothetical protein n=1 Tax=Bacillus atrophaeus TaxID=1452 RepID=UPI002161EDBB|nr:hypothetical protein [Bacillus atrophaeus]
MTNPATGDIVAEEAYAGKREAKKRVVVGGAKKLTEVWQADERVRKISFTGREGRYYGIEEFIEIKYTSVALR